jgi:hypothetical protein
LGARNLENAASNNARRDFRRLGFAKLRLDPFASVRWARRPQFAPFDRLAGLAF